MRKDKREWFGAVRWCGEDIESRLHDFEVDDKDFPEAFSYVRNQCENHNFVDRQIEAGWDCIDAYIEEYQRRKNVVV